MKPFIYTVAVVLTIAIIGGISYGGWMLSRKWNYNMSYKAMVKETVREMVKESALK
jgi:phosphoribosylformylglycinamidine (FGAM) synthase-like amidotransferase family enzyme